MSLDGLSPDFRPDIAAGIHAMPASALLGLSCLGFAEGRSAIELVIRPGLTFDGRVVQGGIVGTLADYAAVSAIAAGVPAGFFAATTGFTVQNLAPAAGERLVGLGRMISRSKSSAAGAADVYAVTGDEWRLVATCLATSRLSELGA